MYFSGVLTVRSRLKKAKNLYNYIFSIFDVVIRSAADIIVNLGL